MQLWDYPPSPADELGGLKSPFFKGDNGACKKFDVKNINYLLTIYSFRQILK